MELYFICPASNYTFNKKSSNMKRFYKLYSKTSIPRNLFIIEGWSFIFLCHARGLWQSQFPEQGLNLGHITEAQNPNH